ALVTRWLVCIGAFTRRATVELLRCMAQAFLVFRMYRILAKFRSDVTAKEHSLVLRQHQGRWPDPCISSVRYGSKRQLSRLLFMEHREASLHGAYAHGGHPSGRQPRHHAICCPPHGAGPCPAPSLCPPPSRH